MAILLDNSLLDGPDFVNYEFWDETSQFDPHPTRRWVHGSEYYERLYRCRIPLSIADNDEAIEVWLYENDGRITWIE